MVADTPPMHYSLQQQLRALHKQHCEQAVQCQQRCRFAVSADESLIRTTQDTVGQLQ
jgi:hypothetical protein